ncbi:hypothetical protein [Rhizobium sp. LjRoot258]|uniref:hypothetical protein n=1 Tax=Rhizobium sp. LjRoot258 TaxID=3342299 RepID=UPI003ED06456
MKPLQGRHWKGDLCQCANEFSVFFFRKAHEQALVLSLHAGARQEDLKLAEAKIEVARQALNVSRLKDRSRFVDTDDSYLMSGKGPDAVDGTQCSRNQIDLFVDRLCGIIRKSEPGQVVAVRARMQHEWLCKMTLTDL